MKMEGERKRSKGSFFNFFDWNGKSRKKLFANDSELPEKTEQGKGNNIDPAAKLEAHLTKLDERRANSSGKGSSEFSCTSSIITSDDGFKTRAPGVVARLMGLNSLPTSNIAGSFLLKETHYNRISPNLNSEYDPMEYTSRRAQNRPFERFQTETLPPKSAKSVPISRHKLLSPIRNPGFAPRKNAADVAEAAAKIIEASPKANMNNKVPSISSPLRIRDFKQKLEVKTTTRPQRKGQLSRSIGTSSRNDSNKKQETRNSENRTGNMLRQNNSRQKVSSTSKKSVPNQAKKGRTIMQNRTVHKVGLKPETMSKVPIDAEKVKSKGTNSKKRPIGKSVAVKCNTEVEGPTSSGFDDDDRKGGMDVVSFTFTSPVNKAISSQSDNKSTPLHGVNIMGADALGALLEEKLRELANKVEPSKCNIIWDDDISTFDAVNTVAEFVTRMDDSNHLDNFDSLSTEDSSLTDNRNWQGCVDVEECSSGNFEKDQYRHPSPVSILEHSFESGSCSNTNADDLPSGETELLDSATSTYKFHAPNWEQNYVRAILDNVETMLKDYELGKTSKALALQLFNQLEKNQHNRTKQNEEDYLKHERKVLFDCVSECLDSMSWQAFVGSYKSWAKLRTVFEKKDRLAREMCKEILSWKNSGDSMVDELVDKEMRSRHGKWVEFDLEISEVGIEIEKEIVTCLVDELVSDFFIL